MMELMWFCVGVLTATAGICIFTLSRHYRFNLIAWIGLGSGAVLVLFTLAWAVGSMLEGVPRAASMGMVFFAMPGIVLLTVTWRYIVARLPRFTPPRVPPASYHSTQHEARQRVTITSSVVTQGKVSRSVSKLLRYAAYAALIGAFIFGKIGANKDYEGMVRKHFHESSLTKINANPLVFQLGEKVGGTGNYVMIQEGQGYGGPFVIGICIMDDAKVHEVLLLESRETPAFLKMIQDAHFSQQFAGKDVTDDFIVGADIDAVSRATISTMAGTEAVRQGAHLAALEYFKLQPDWQKVPWEIGLGEILIIIIFALAFVKAIQRHAIMKYLYCAFTIAVVGFYLNASISISNLSALFMGYVPNINDHIIWWILTVGTVLTIILLGTNVYCYRICPFYGVQFLLSKISRSRLSLSLALLSQTKRIVNVLVWIALMVIFLSSHPALGAYEPFALMFSLQGVGVQWYILPIVIIGAFFTSNYWCRFFCPTGHALSKLMQLRKNTLKLFAKEKPENLYVQDNNGYSSCISKKDWRTPFAGLLYIVATVLIMLFFLQSIRNYLTDLTP